jgi:hypothetical protein
LVFSIENLQVFVKTTELPTFIESKLFQIMKKLLAVTLLLSIYNAVFPRSPKQEYYSIRIYQLKNSDQEARVEKFLQTAFVPAMHRLGFSEIGVFKPVGNDTAAIRKIYVLIPARTMEQLATLPQILEKDAQYQADGKDYLDAPWDNPPYLRMESILLEAFPDMPRHAVPAALQGPRDKRIYELRSYEGPTERYFVNKVRMFNQGGEIPLFQRLGFNAVFYASVISGAHMPNLMYMTSFDDMAARDAHWKTFGSDPFWKQLVAAPEYQHNVSHVDIVFLHPAACSDL